MIRFLLGGFPRLVRSEWRSVCVASLLFFGSLALMGLLTYLYPELIFSLVSPDQVSEMERMYDPDARRLGQMCIRDRHYEFPTSTAPGTPMPTTLLTLRDSLTQLTLAPELGASLVNWVRLSDGRALLRHSEDVYKRQASIPRTSATPWSMACRPIARCGGTTARPRTWACLLYTSRCV